MFREFPATRIINELGRDNLLPAILFRTSRRQCDDDIEFLAEARREVISPSDQNSLHEEVDRAIAKYGLDPAVIKDHPHFDALIRTACGAHHAGQLLMWRLLLEELMTHNQLRLMIATGTVAAGVDFPARTVVITSHSKRGSDGFNVLRPSEFQQMSGRAGRRGKDSVGFCLIAPGQFSDARVFSEVAKMPPEPLRSAYFAAPSTVLNLLKFRNVDDLRFTVEKSLASFLDKKKADGVREEASLLEQSILLQEKLRGSALEDEVEASSPGEPGERSVRRMSSEALKKARKRHRRWIRESDVLEQRQTDQLDLSLEGLGRLGYLDARGLTEKGIWAAELCTSLVLQLGEAIADGLLHDLNELELAGLVGSIAGDAHRSYLHLGTNVVERSLFAKLEQVVERVNHAYLGPTTASDVKVQPDAALTVTSWMLADDWKQFGALLRLAGVAEGDAARVVTQTADHLHQISRLKDSHPDLAKRAWEARGRILRPPLTDTIPLD